MAFTLDNDRGTLTADGTEQTLKAEVSSGTFILYVNAVNMADGDVVELRAYMKMLTGDGQLYLLFEDELSNEQGDGGAVGSSADGEVLYKFPPVEGPFAVTWTLKQVAGTFRMFPWREDQIG